MDVLWAIVRPAVTAVEGVQVLNIAVQTLLRKLSSILLEAEIGEYPEPEPVGVGHA